MNWNRFWFVSSFVLCGGYVSSMWSECHDVMPILIQLSISLVLSLILTWAFYKKHEQ